MYYLREKISGIYSYRDLREGYKVIYIGQSRDIYRRHRGHCGNRKYKQPIDKIIAKDPKRYVLYIEDICEEAQLNNLERKYIKKYQPIYNCTKGGDYIHIKNHHGGRKKYTKYWDTRKTHYINAQTCNRNRAFRVYYNGHYVPCGFFEDWISAHIVWGLIDEEVNNEIK